MQRCTWKRSVLNGVLTTALLLGVPAAGGAVACYRKHIQAVYWGWKWADTFRGTGVAFPLGAKLTEIRAPKSARVAAWRTAYRLTSDFGKRFVAEEFGEDDIRALYQLVQEEGKGSIAEDALKTVLVSVGDSEEPLFPDGAIQRDFGEMYPFDEDIEDQRPNPVGRYYCTTWGPSFRFGSYDVRLERRWSKWPIEAEWSLCGVEDYEMERVPGPWRDLAPPGQEGEDVY